MEKITVVKIGGNIVDHPENLDAFIQKFSALEGKKALVHGGGKVATQISKALGIETQMINGRRVTDAETVDVVTMVYAGLVNKKVVSKLQAQGQNAIGFCGADANLIQAHKRPVVDVDYGFVGDIDKVDGEFLKMVIESGKVPVTAPITHDGKGQLLNTNADTIASEVSIALSEFYDVTLLYAFELPGVLEDIDKPESLISQINPEQYKELLDQGIIAKGMIPKMDNCYNAISRGVSNVMIGHALDLENLFSESRSTGTLLVG